MIRVLGIIGVCAGILTGCGIPPVNKALISNQPANARDFAVAQNAVRACTDLLRPNKLRAAFQRYGFKISETTETGRRNRKIKRVIIEAPNDRVSVLVTGSRCYVGLEGMTPQQSTQLASIWVKAHRASPNSASGDGLSDHVSGAWRNFFTEPARLPDKAAYQHRIYIAAYKTWPHGPYDPQRNVPYDITGTFPNMPGAAVKLTHAVECKGVVKTGPRSGVFLPCSEPDYRPK